MKPFFSIIASILTLLFSVFPASGSNENKAVRLFSDPEILTGLYTGFCIDHDGFLWIGSDTGLFRFDGNKYDVYRHDNTKPGTISDNRILKIICDSKGNLWIATANGLNLYNPDTDSFTLISLPDKGFNGYILGLLEQNDGTITFIASGVGLYVIDHNGSQPVAVRYLTHTIGEKTFSHLIQSKDGRLFAGCHYGLLCIISPNGNATTRQISSPSDYVTDMAHENDGNILISTTNDIYRYDPIADKLTTLSTRSQSKLTINSITCGKDGTAYIATQGMGLWTIRPGSDTIEKDHSLYSPHLDLSNLKIGATYIDPNDNLWIGCNYYGVVIVPSTPIPFFYRNLKDVAPSFSGGLSTIAVFGSKLLVSTNNGNILILNPNGSISAKAATPSGYDATSIIAESDNTALVGVANDGIYRLDISTGRMSTLLRIDGKFPSIRLCTSSDGDIFAGVHGIGLLKYDRATRTQQWFYNEDYGIQLSNNYIASMHRSPDDKIWIGLYSGIACYDCRSDSLMTIDQETFLKGVIFVFEDGPDGSLYIGTSHGLIHFHPDRGVIRKYSTEDGLSDHEVRSLTSDLNGNLWIGTMHGLSFMLHGSDKIFSYHGGYGLYEKHYPYAVTSKTGGMVYFGNDSGITSLDPTTVTAPEFDCDVKVSALYVNGTKISADTKSDGRYIIEGNALSPTNLYLTYKDNTITMQLSTMDFRDASNMRYKWHIKELDDKWSRTLPGENAITLPPLDPGDYTLQLKACENNISSKLTEIQIHVASPWYTSNIAKILYLLILTAILVLSVSVMEKKKEEKINEAKIRFFIDISHDIRSPVTLILSPLESLLKQPLPSDVTAKLQTMRRNAHRLLSLVNQLLDLRRIEKGKMRLSYLPTDMRSFISELVEMYKSQAEAEHKSMEFVCDDQLPNVSIDRDNFDKILVNLISNAIKYTPEGGNIQVKLKEADDDEIGKCAEIQVIDSGIGLDSKTLTHIFDRFYRARENHANSTVGFGIGLDLCRQLVTLHNGTISAANRSDGTKGSIFTVRIPIHQPKQPDNQDISIGGGNLPPEAGNNMKHLAGAYIPNQSSTVATQRNKTRYSTSNRRILVVDDDAELREYVRENLSGIYKVTTASNGAEAMKLILDNVPDLVVSDVVMPEMDGLTLLKQLKSNVHTHHVPVILLSSKSDIADRMAGWNRGADGYIGKPFNIEELDMMIDNIIDNRLKLKGKFSGAQDNDDKIATPEMKGNDEALMEKIMAIINTHINDPLLNVEKLGREVGISRAHLHRKMKELIGMTPSDFIRNIRLRRACELLKKPDVDITQVAYTLGFTSQPHFSTAFKRFTGVSPTEYRTLHIQGKSPKIPDMPS